MSTFLRLRVHYITSTSQCNTSTLRVHYEYITSTLRVHYEYITSTLRVHYEYITSTSRVHYEYIAAEADVSAAKLLTGSSDESTCDGEEYSE